MPRVHKRVAAKDYPQSGIKKGDTYYYTKIKQQRGGIVKRSLTPFKRSELTTSDFLSQVYDIEDSLAACTAPDEFGEIAEQLRALGQEQRDKFDNMPEGLQYGDTGQMLEQRADGCEAAADEIETAQSEFESEWPDEPTEDEWDRDSYETWEDAMMAYDEAKEAALAQGQDVAIDY